MKKTRVTGHELTGEGLVLDVAATLRIAWRTVGAVVERVLARLGPRDLLSGLRRIGVDELSYQKHHEYLTVVVDHDSGRVVWARPGKNADTLRAFFDELGPERCARLENVSIDMSQAYVEAVREKAPRAEIVFDRFHVQRLAHDALDQVRRAEVAAEGLRTPRGKTLKRTRWLLQKNPWNLSTIESARLSFLQRANKALYRTYLLKESLAAVLDGRDAKLAGEKLLEWCRWAVRARLKPFARVARTIRSHLDGIVAYVPHSPLQRPGRGPQRQGPHHHPQGLRLSSGRVAHRDALSLLLRHHPPS